jgi:large subunit ribosomal protein L4
MLDVPVYNTAGEKIDTFRVDEAVFGGQVNVALLKQAIVAYHANRRQGTAATRSRGMVHGSGRKLYRQKGTGRARRGNLRTNIMRGGGVAFAKVPHSYRQVLPRKMRRAATHSAILAKLLGSDLLIVDGLRFEAPKTRQMADILAALKIERSCLLTLEQRDGDAYLSARNIPGLTVRVVDELNAFDIATRQKMLVTLAAMKAMTGRAAEPR